MKTQGRKCQRCAELERRLSEATEERDKLRYELRNMRITKPDLLLAQAKAKFTALVDELVVKCFSNIEVLSFLDWAMDDLAGRELKVRFVVEYPLRCHGCRGTWEGNAGPMLHDDVWSAIGGNHTMLCFDCTQERMRKRFGRTLVRGDMTICPFNAEWLGSPDFAG